MTNLYIKQKGPLPVVFFDGENGKLEIKGQCSPSNADIFFKPLFDWLNDYINYPRETTILEFYLSYFNTMSAKNVLQLMKIMEDLSKTGKDVKIRWLYLDGDEDLEEAGSDFESILSVPFEIVAVNE